MLCVTYWYLFSSNYKTNAMRKGILLFCIAVLLLSALSSFAYLQYKSAAISGNEKAVCCTINNSGETIFESMVKQFVGAVKVGN